MPTGSLGPYGPHGGPKLWPIMGPERPKLGPIIGLWGAEAWAHMGPSLGPSWPYGGPMLWPIMGPEKPKFGSIMAHKGGHSLRPSCAHRGQNFGPVWAPGRPRLGSIMGLGSPKLGPIMGLWEAQAWVHYGPMMGPSLGRTAHQQLPQRSWLNRNTAPTHYMI